MNTRTRTLPGWRFLLHRHDDPTPPPPSAPAPAADLAADPAGDPAGDPADRPLGPAGEKALEEWKKRAKEAEAAARTAAEKVREFEERDQTELEKAQAAAARATAEAEAARSELLRQRIVNETGLSADLAEFLPTGDEETVRAAAQKLAAATVAVKPGPRPDPSQGSGRPAPPPTDFRTASKDELRSELRKLGIRSQV